MSVMTWLKDRRIASLRAEIAEAERLAAKWRQKQSDCACKAYYMDAMATR